MRSGADQKPLASEDVRVHVYYSILNLALDAQTDNGKMEPYM